MRMKRSHGMDPGTTPRVPDQIIALVHRYLLDHFRLRQPSKRIVYRHGLIEDRGKDATKARQGLRMRRSGCPSTDDLTDHRQIQADNAVLEKTNPSFVKK